MDIERLFHEVRADIAARAHLPTSTYRVQLSPSFRLAEAQAIVPYLAKLGVSDLYSSPCLKATPGSLHGYDVVDHGQLNPELGTEEEHRRLCQALKEHGMGLLLDFVPNHMGIERDNQKWREVLENGPASAYARFFDIDWDPVTEELKNKVLLPVLGDQYGIVLENGELKLELESGTFQVRHGQQVFPIAPRAYRQVLGLDLERLGEELGHSHLDFIELQSILTAIEHLPLRTETERGKVLERSREKEVIKRRLRALLERNPQVAAFVARNVERINGRVGDARSFDRLDAILSSCSHRLAHWRVAGEEINYRRFFDVNALAAIRVEDPDVFAEVHQKVFEWIAEGRVSGLRIDHPDGLFDPTAYFLDLQERYFLGLARQRVGDEGVWRAVEPELKAAFRREVLSDADSPLRRGLYVVIEKIQGGRERIPEAWAVHGTTGYRFANAVGGIFVDRAAERAMTELYERFVGRSYDWHELVYEKKKLVMSASMASEVNVLARELHRISEMDRRTRDFTLNSLRRALMELIALFPVYRTYVDGWREKLDDRDVRYIEGTIEAAKAKDPSSNVTIYDFLRDILLRRSPAHLTEEQRRVRLRFVMRWQQVTGPVMAKGVEDTAFYVYNRLVSLNEVGGEPERFGTSVDLFHLRNQERAEKWPYSLLATSTHDTKRSEDVRARLNVLSEIPAEWAERVHRWAAMNGRHKTMRGDRPMPDRNDEYLFYQTVVGALPMGGAPRGEEYASFRRRIGEYMQKAIKEAKVNTSWINPDSAYEAAMARFVDACLSADGQAFLRDAVAFKQTIERAGQVNSLGQLALKLASPGTADIYQGCELWDLSLVDPDNRRPVDFAERARLLELLDRAAAESRERLCRELFADMTDGRIKLFVTAEGLRLRRRTGGFFNRASYTPLDFSGPFADHAVGFLRREGGRCAVALVPRLVRRSLDEPGGLSRAFAGTTAMLPAAELTDIFTHRVFDGRRPVDLGEIFSAFPVALLYKGGA